MEITIQALISLITLIGTLSAIHIRLCNSFFMSLVKSEYNEIPSEQSIFNVVVDVLVCFLYVTYIYLGTIIICNLNINTLKETLYNTNRLLVAVLFICIIIILYLTIKTIINICKIKNMIVDRLNNKKIRVEKPNNKVINIFTFLNISDIAILLCCSASLFGGFIFSLNDKIIINKDSIEIIKCAEISWLQLFLAILYISVSLVAINIKNITKSLEENNIYEFKGDVSVKCRYYLEYKDYYLVIKNNKEIYINKSKVNMIIKYKEVNEED